MSRKIGLWSCRDTVIPPTGRGILGHQSAEVRAPIQMIDARSDNADGGVGRPWMSRAALRPPESAGDGG
jgi:hypothetical protein